MHEAYDLSGLGEEASESFEDFLKQMEEGQKNKKNMKKGGADAASSLRVDKKTITRPTVKTVSVDFIRNESGLDLSGLSDELIVDFANFVRSLDVEVTTRHEPAKVYTPAKVVYIHPEIGLDNSLEFEEIIREIEEENTQKDLESYIDLKAEDEIDDSLFLEISKNLNRKIEEELDNPKKISDLRSFKEKKLQNKQPAKRDVKKAEKTSQRAMKRAKRKAQRKHKRYVLSNRYEPKTKRNFFQNMRNRKRMFCGEYDWVYDVENPKVLFPEEQKEYWEDVDKLEDAINFDRRLNRKLNSFRMGIAAVGLAAVITIGSYAANAIVPKANENLVFPTTIITQVTGQKLDLEVERAKAALFDGFKDQEYLLERINDNFIPENMTEEQKYDLMIEAWEALEPEVRRWIRDPEKARAAELRSQEKERQRVANQAEIAARNAPKQANEEANQMLTEIERGD